jgi:hypothetical protein
MSNICRPMQRHPLSGTHGGIRSPTGRETS